VLKEQTFPVKETAMPRRLFASLLLLVLVATPGGARAADAKPATPPLVIRFQSIDDLRADILYLGKLVGQEDRVKEFDSLLQSQLGDKSIDTKKPFGLYAVVVGIGDAAAVGLVPVADEKALLDLAGQLGSKPEKGDDGIYSTTPNAAPGATVYFRFAHRYAYVAYGNKDRIAKDQLLDPATLLAVDRPATASVVVRLDGISDDMKDLALQQFDQGLEGAKEAKGPQETDVQHKVKGQVLDDFGKRVNRVVKEGTSLEVRFNVNRKQERISLEGSFKAKPGTDLASRITALGEMRSVFAGLTRPDAALNVLAHVAVPEGLRKPLASVVDEVIEKGLQNEKDENKRQEAERLLKALAPTIRAGELDTALTMRGPDADKHYTVLLGLKVSQGKQLEKAFRDLARRLPERDRAKIKWDVETVNRVRVHRAAFQDQLDENARRTLGDNAVYFAFRDDRVVAVLGPGGLAAIKDLVSAEAAPGPLFEESAALSHLAALMTAEHPNAPQAAQAAFGAGGHDRVGFTLRGGKALTARLVVDAAVLKFAGQLATHARGQALEREREAAEKAAREAKPPQ
jgi:hypothetical protein